MLKVLVSLLFQIFAITAGNNIKTHPITDLVTELLFLLVNAGFLI